MSDINQFYLNKSEPNRSCLLVLRELITKQDTHITETTKYGMPCFCYKKKMCCYLWVDKETEEPYILFVEGKRLSHAKLESGKRSRMKIFRINPLLDIPKDDLEGLLNDALNLYREGVIKS